MRPGVDLGPIAVSLACSRVELDYLPGYRISRVTTTMDLITEIWAGLKDAGLPEVMLYLPDGSACRCHWDDTALIGSIRVALLADQDRKVVRVMPVHECQGIGIASPKGIDPAGYRAVIQSKLIERFTPKPSSSP